MSENKQPINESSTVFAKREYKNKKVLSIKKRRAIKVICSLLAVIMLGGAVFWALKAQKPEQEVLYTEDNSASVVNVDMDSVKSVTVKSDSSTVKFLSGKDGSSWYIDGISASLTNSGTISNVISDATLLSAIDTTEQNKNSDYGFNKPYAEVIVDCKKGNEQGAKDYSFTIGNLTADQESRYLKLSGDETIYLITSDTASNFIFKPQDFALTDVVDSVELSEEDAQNEETAAYFNSGLLAAFDRCTVSGKRAEYELQIDFVEGSTYEMKKPQKRKVTPDSVVNFLNILKYGLTAETVYSYNQDNAETYGLSNPITVSVTADKYSAKIYIGNRSDDGYYAVTSSKKAPIFKVAETELEFLFNDVSSYFSKNVFSESVDSFSSIEFSTEGTKLNLTFLEAESESETPRVFIGENEIEFEQYRRLYKRFLDFSVSDEDASEVKTANTVFTAKFNFFDETKKSRIIEIKQYTARKYVVFVDSEPLTIIKKPVLNDLLNSLQNLKDGKEVSDIQL